MAEEKNIGVADFRELYPEFSNPENYSDKRLELALSTASTYIEESQYLNGNMYIEAIGLMCAHILTMRSQRANSAAGDVAGGGGGGIITSATIDKVSVSYAAPAKRGNLIDWLNQTDYGRELVALLDLIFVGGDYQTPAPERLPFRKVFGRY